MPLKISCPSCGVVLTIADANIGLRMACPKCATRIETQTAPTKITPARLATPAIPLPDDAFDEEPKPPRPKKRAIRLEGEADDKPKPRRKAKKPVLPPNVMLYVGGGMLAFLILICVGCGGYFTLFYKSGTAGVVTRSPLDRAPSGWVTVTDVKGKYTIQLPGPSTQTARVDGWNMTMGAAISEHQTFNFVGLDACISSYPVQPGSWVKNSEAELLAELRSKAFPVGNSFNKIKSQRFVTLNGVTALEVYIGPDPNKMTNSLTNGKAPVPPAGMSAKDRKEWEEQQNRMLEATRKADEAAVRMGIYYVYYITMTVDRIYIFDVHQSSSYPDETMIKNFRESFRVN